MLRLAMTTPVVLYGVLTMLYCVLPNTGEVLLHEASRDASRPEPPSEQTGGKCHIRLSMHYPVEANPFFLVLVTINRTDAKLHTP